MVMAAIELSNVNFTYPNLQRGDANTLSDINLSIAAGSYTAIIGHTGSGKSTLVSLIDGLLVPSSGQVRVGKVTVTNEAKQADLAQLRQHVGFVFQFPEQQLFAETVAQDVAFGPENLGWPPEKVKAAVKQSIADVGLPKEIGERSPFMLSGGQMRRAAIAGVLAMKPSILILDEPTAGLDAQSTDQLLSLVAKLNATGTTIILITHQMEQVAAYADQVVVMNHGRLVTSTVPQKLFSNPQLLTDNHLAQPLAIKMRQRLQDKGLSLPLALTLDDLADNLASRMGGVADE
jgi:energy-coupling factor transport system ATP-binding protein